MSGFFGTWWSVLPPLISICLALVSKEVYSSLFVGILSGGLLYSGFSFEGTMNQVFVAGFMKSIADVHNIGILMFLVFLGALVAMMNRTGASAAFGKWAAAHIRSNRGAQFATILLGLIIFIDDYFNCLTVGSVMRPITDAKRVSRAKLAYLIDATAAPVCIIAPISSWAAAVAGFAKDAGAESGFALFVSAIPYNLYAFLTIAMMVFLALSGFDFGLMGRCERDAAKGAALREAVARVECIRANERGRVCDLVLPVVVLVAACVIGMIYSGGYFGTGAAAGDFIRAFAASEASVGLVLGSPVALAFTVVFYLCRRVISFQDCMDSIPEGFRAMVPAILILCCAWTLKSMTDALGAREFIAGVVNGSAASLCAFLPAVIFVIAAVLAFATGTSWSTFGILIPICLAAISKGELTVVAIAACMAGAVCGDHCSPISDTTIMASAGAQCNHMDHVNTQLPYVMVCAGVSFVGYLIAGFCPRWQVVLPLSVMLMLAVLFVMRFLLRRGGGGSK